MVLIAFKASRQDLCSLCLSSGAKFASLPLVSLCFGYLVRRSVTEFIVALDIVQYCCPGGEN